jgi:BR serine/threonine kinase
MSSVGKLIGDYEFLKPLGKGTSAKVKLARNIRTEQIVAVKSIKKANLASKPIFFSKLQREIALMGLFEHPHILRMYEVFESPNHLHIVVEHAANGELLDLLVQQKRVPEEVGIEMLREIVYALEYLHHHGICHRDLKPENILLDENRRIKIADFGFARWMRQDVASTACGSPQYAAPEVIRAQPYAGKLADIWSLGVILYALLAVRFPIADLTHRVDFRSKTIH